MSATGAVIMSVFAAIWWVAGAKTSGHGSVPMYSVALVVTGGIIALASRRVARAAPLTPVEDARQGRLVGIASVAESIAILVAANVLVNIGKADFINKTGR